MKSTNRLILLALVFVFVLVAAGSVLAADEYENPNCDFMEGGPPYGLPYHWTLVGDVIYTEDKLDPPDHFLFFPDTEKTSAFYQVFNVPAGALPNTYVIETEINKRDLTANTVFMGVIIYYNDGTKSRVYKRVPPGSVISEDLYLYPYFSDNVDYVKLGTVYFGKRGGGLFATDEFCMGYPGDLD
jgi:hypothetical protein